ncbi:MAG: glycerophosphodiester phosphodiesterase family protein [Bacteroides sp.]
MKRIFYLLICLLPLSVWGQDCRVDTLLSLLNRGSKNHHVMIFAHRGDWRYAPENSILSYQRCIEEGLDGIEVDVQCSKDSVLVVMHDETLERTTTGCGRVSDYTVSELKQLYLKSPIGVVTRQRIPTFREVLQLAKGKILIQVDKWPPVKDLVIAEAKRSGCLNQLIFRSSKRSEEVKRIFGDELGCINYIPVLVCNSKNNNEKLDDFITNLTVGCISFSFKADDCRVLQRISEVKSEGYKIWLNSLWETFNGGHDDELALTDKEASYGWLLSLGADVIFSDHPMLLKKYLEQKGLRQF